jgi:hypothetical protein
MTRLPPNESSRRESQFAYAADNHEPFFNSIDPTETLAAEFAVMHNAAW